MSPRRNDLEAYRKKRDPERTTEPFGSGSEARDVAPSGERFVVQQHSAR